MIFALIVIFVLIALVFAYVTTRPDTFELSRSILIAAPPERIFPLIDDLRAMNGWNPFVKADPNIKLVYSEPSSGAGASCDFEGNVQVGAGRILTTESLMPSTVVMSLRIQRPMKAQNRVEFILVPQETGTKVTWSMSGEQPLMAKVMSIVLSTDRMAGGAFETGLADLKRLAET